LDQGHDTFDWGGIEEQSGRVDDARLGQQALDEALQFKIRQI
jgi:hypothetical protein